jgi:hypothetical protein
MTKRTRYLLPTAFVCVAALGFMGTAQAAAPTAGKTQVELKLLSAQGTLESSVSGTWDSPYHWNETDQGVNQQVQGTLNHTITWKAPKQQVPSAVFGPGAICSFDGNSCIIRIGKVTASSSTTGSATYADGTTKDCTNSVARLGRTFFSDSAINDLFIHFEGSTPAKSTVWLTGGSPFTGVPSDSCEILGGLGVGTYEYKVPLPYTKFTKARIGKPFTVTIKTTAPITGTTKAGDINVGTLTFYSTLKFVVTGKFTF